MRTRLPFVALLSLCLSGATACGTITTSVTSPSVIPKVVNFVSRIQEHGSAWRSFVMVAGDVSVQLTSVSQGTTTMGLGLGTVDGTNCVISQAVETDPNSASVGPQITATLPTGTYCVKVWDIGNLTTIADFAVVITFPS